MNPGPALTVRSGADGSEMFSTEFVVPAFAQLTVSGAGDVNADGRGEYSLAGVDQDAGVCPECGRPFELADVRQRLQAAHFRSP